jgi:predicted nucleotidyltransferase
LTEPAFDQLLRRLSKAEVEFVLIGGLAINAWGVVRGTKDVDVVVAPDPENLKRVAGVAVATHGHIQTGESFLSTPPSIAAGSSQTESASPSRPSLVSWTSSRASTAFPPYDELRARATEVEVLGIKVFVCSVEDLRATKRAAGRTRDQADLEDLNATGH